MAKERSYNKQTPAKTLSEITSESSRCGYSRKAENTVIWSSLTALEFPKFPQAACASRDPMLWDYDNESVAESYVSRGRRHDKAIRVCNGCPHRQSCEDFARKFDLNGVWGGKLFVPVNRRFLRCSRCNKSMLLKPRKKLPRNFRNKHTDELCFQCHSYDLYRQDVDSRRKARQAARVAQA